MRVSLLAMPALLFATTAALAQSPPEQAVELYWSGQYQETIQTLTPQRIAELLHDEKVECLKYLAFSQVAVGGEDEARDVFVEQTKGANSPKQHMACLGAALGVHDLESDQAREEVEQREAKLTILPPCTWCGLPTGNWCDACEEQPWGFWRGLVGCIETRLTPVCSTCEDEFAVCRQCTVEWPAE